MDTMSDAYREALCSRATGIGLVPVSIIARLTPAEWAVIRVMGQREAKELVNLHNADPVPRPVTAYGTEAVTVVKVPQKAGHEH